MHQDIVVDVRTAAQPAPGPISTAPTMTCVLKELGTAKQLTNGLACSAYSQLDGEGMHTLAMIEGLIAGAMKKIAATGGAS